MATKKSSPQWTTQLTLAPIPSGHSVPGDKIVLPPAALEQILSATATVSDAQVFSPVRRRRAVDLIDDVEEVHDSSNEGLPQPLMFKLVSPTTGRAVFAGIQEFSAEDGQILISDFLRSALGAEAGPQTLVTVHLQRLQKGIYVKLRPLEAGYDVDDWKALLEQHLRTNYTTLTRNEILEIPADSTTTLRFLVDHFGPADADGICVVETDLEVDIEALNEDQARATVKQIADKFKAGGMNGAVKSGDLDIFHDIHGSIEDDLYVDYQIKSWPRDRQLDIELEGGDSLSLLVSPYSTSHRSRPRLDDHVFADFDDRPLKRVRLQPTNVELGDAESLFVAVHAFPCNDSKPQSETFTLRARPSETGSKSKDTPLLVHPINPDDVRCENCHQLVPNRTLMLHENFCLRNNILCPQGCGQVFQKKSEELQDHWHCPFDTFYGNGKTTKSKHDLLYHPAEPIHCARCSTAHTFSSIPLLAHHHTTTCSGRIILCQFCHLNVPQDGDPDEPDAEALISGLTVHELKDGSRTTECHLCGKITRMRDMTTHLKHHDLERKSRPRPRLCRNVNCCNTLKGDPGNDIGLCSVCYGPLYASTYDPEGKVLKRRVERRYLQQLTSGCGKHWCRNDFCKNGRKNTGQPDYATTTKTALQLAKPFVDATLSTSASPLHFCVEETNSRNKEKALVLEVDSRQSLGNKGYDLVWCAAAIEAEHGDLDKARTWLENYAPRIDEEKIK